jgi:hypothetical protein
MSKFTRKEIEAAMGAVKLIVERHGNPKKVPKKVWTEHEIKNAMDAVIKKLETLPKDFFEKTGEKR